MGGSTSLQFRIWWAYSKFYFSVSFKLSGLDHRKHMGTQEDINYYGRNQKAYIARTTFSDALSSVKTVCNRISQFIFILRNRSPLDIRYLQQFAFILNRSMWSSCAEMPYLTSWTFFSNEKTYVFDKYLMKSLGVISWTPKQNMLQNTVLQTCIWWHYRYIPSAG